MAQITITEMYVAGFTVIDLGYGQLVASQSTPGSWYVIERDTCSCPSFAHRGKCKHLDAVREMVGEEVTEEDPDPTPEEYVAVLRQMAEGFAREGECPVPGDPTDEEW